MAKIAHLTSVHAAFDIRIFHKECKSLARHGHQVTLVVPHVRDEVVGGVCIKSIPRLRHRLSRMTRTTWRVFRQALRAKADLYHFHDPELIPVGLLLVLLGSDPAALAGGFNLLRAIFADGGLQAAFVNADEVCASIWQRAEHEADHVDGLAALLAELRPHAPPRRGAAAGEAPLLYTRIRSGAGELRFFSAFTTFGAPLDVTLASLRIEHLFPADDATRRALAAP